MTKVYSACLIGCQPILVEINLVSNQGLPKLVLLGVSGKKSHQLRNKVLAAIKSINLKLSACRRIISFSPDLSRKETNQLELALAVGLLANSNKIKLDLAKTLIVGSLSLCGEVKPVTGTLYYLQLAKQHNLEQVIIPFGNCEQAKLGSKINKLGSKINMIGAESLQQVIAWLNQGKLPSPATNSTKSPPFTKTAKPAKVKISEVIGQNTAKRALTIAAAGRHHLLMIGPPGVGKTLLARSVESILPALTGERMQIATKVYSLENKFSQCVVSQPKVRFIHPSDSKMTIFGGGKKLKPGEVSLADQGVLIADELPNFPHSVLQRLASAVENKKILLRSSSGVSHFPTRFMLVATMNPCPCGYYQTNIKTCRCGPRQRKTYRQRLSGALLDRIDLCVYLAPVEEGVVVDSELDSTTSIRQAVAKARKKQNKRYSQQRVMFNSNLSATEVGKHLRPTTDGLNLLRAVKQKLKLSTRSYFKVIKVARTIADLDSNKQIKQNHLQEAINYTVERNLIVNND